MPEPKQDLPGTGIPAPSSEEDRKEKPRTGELATQSEGQRAAAWPPGYFEEVVGGWQGDPLTREEPW